MQTLTRYGENTGTNSPFLQAALFIQEYLVRIVEPAVYGLYAGQRILDVSAGNFAIRLDDSGRISGHSFMSRRFAALSSDSAAGHPDAVVVPDRDSLIDWMFARMADEHLRPLFQRVRTVSRLSQNVMWADVAGRCVEALINLQRAGRLTMEEAIAEKTALLARAPHPLRDCVSLYPLRSGSNQELFMRIEVCCQKYLHPEMGKCGYCGLRPVSEQLQLQMTVLNRRIAERRRKDCS